MTAAEGRYLADLRIQEITRALRALSSAYVERRERGSGQRVRGALDTAGKRAAFALYYAPLHFIAVTEAVQALRATDSVSGSITDLGCGTGAAGAAWALAAGSTPAVFGIDRHPWAVSEARWTFSQLGVKGLCQTRRHRSRTQFSPGRKRDRRLHAERTARRRTRPGGAAVVRARPAGRPRPHPGAACAGRCTMVAGNGETSDRSRRPGGRVEDQRGSTVDRTPARHRRRTQLPRTPLSDDLSSEMTPGVISQPARGNRTRCLL